MALTPATTQQHLPATKKGPELPVNPDAKAKYSHRPADSGYWAPLKNVNAFLHGLKRSYGYLTMDVGLQKPTAIQVWEHDKEGHTERLSNALGDLATFGGDTCPITLPNNEQSQIWPIAEEMLRNPQKFGVTAEMTGAKKLTPWGQKAVLAPPSK